MRRNEGLFCELVATEQVEISGFGGNHDRLKCLADGCAFFWLSIEKFSEIVITFNFY